MEDLLGAVAVFLFVVLGLVLVSYIVEAIFLNKFNKLVYGKGTPMAWIPIANIYLLGKLTFNKAVGWVLVILCFISGTTTITTDGGYYTTSILPVGISAIVTGVYSLAMLVLFIYAIVKYFKIKKNVVVNQNNFYQQPYAQPVQSVVPTMPVQAVQSVEPIVLVQPVQSVEPTMPVQPVQSVESTIPVQTPNDNNEIL